MFSVANAYVKDTTYGAHTAPPVGLFSLEVGRSASAAASTLRPYIQWNPEN